MSVKNAKKYLGDGMMDPLSMKEYIKGQMAVQGLSKKDIGIAIAILIFSAVMSLLTFYLVVKKFMGG